MVLLLCLRQGLEHLGILLNPFYYIRESTPEEPPEPCKKIPEEFEFSLFGPEELDLISRHPERKGYVDPAYVLDNFAHGDLCLGCKCRGEIAGFTWYSLTENRHWFYSCKMQENEAYLLDMYIFKAYRRHHLSLILRYQNYLLLNAQGRTRFYSITDLTNTASLCFKQRLGAKKVFLGLHIEFWKRWQKRWVLKRYPD